MPSFFASEPFVSSTIREVCENHRPETLTFRFGWTKIILKNNHAWYISLTISGKIHFWPKMSKMRNSMCAGSYFWCMDVWGNQEKKNIFQSKPYITNVHKKCKGKIYTKRYLEMLKQKLCYFIYVKDNVGFNHMIDSPQRHSCI